MLSASSDEDTGVVARAQQVARNVWDVVEWPVQDLAGTLGWDVAALTGLLFGIKLVAMGWHGEKQRVRGR